MSFINPSVSRQPGASTASDLSELNVFPCFMPDEPCIDKIVEWIHNARESIIVQAYSFSSGKIEGALLIAKQRGVKVTIMIDKDAEKKPNSLIPRLKNKIDIVVDKQAGKAHNKVMIIDDEHVITGSYNWTDEQYYNDSDSIVFIRDLCVNKKFRYNYEVLINQSYNDLQMLINNMGFSQVDCGNCRFPYLNNLHSANYTDIDGFTTITTKNKKKKQKSEHFVDVHVCFPRLNNQDCIQLITSYINNANKSIFIQACSLTHKDILQALIRVRNKHIDIKLLVDAKAFSDKGELVNILIDSGIDVRCDTSCYPGIAHSKTIIIDNDLVLTGSLNLTYSAQIANQENLLQIRNILVNEMFKNKFCAKWCASKTIDRQNKSYCVVS